MSKPHYSSKVFQLYRIFVSVFLFLWAATSSAQNSNWNTIPLNDLNSFVNAGKNWLVSGDAGASITQTGNMEAVKGKGVLVNVLSDKNKSHLITKQQFTDVEVELDFMMAKNSNSGVYLLGRYEIQLFDSWTNTNPTFADCGGIYQRWDEKRPDTLKGYEGTAPLMNVAKAPGLWQHLKIKFLAPRFDPKGKKIADARFEEVYLNGTLIQQQAQVTGPTRASVFEDEKPAGPIVFQGDHGAVAFRNIRYRSYKPSIKPASGKQEFTDPILVNPQNKPYLLRSFMDFGNKKLTHVISAGSTGQLNFSYDLRQGAMFRIWRGQFLDVTDMWHERGEPQLAVPLGSVIDLSDAPAIAVLANEKATWPDSMMFDDVKINGYVLDKQRFPTFSYAIKGVEVADKILPQSNGESILRELTVSNAPQNLYCRIAAAKKIQLIADGLYSIDDKSLLPAY